MGTKVGAGSGIEAGRAQFEDWRSRRAGKSPIPDELWSAAIKAARQEGVGRAAGHQHLDAGKLKRLLIAADDRERGAPRKPRFVELLVDVAEEMNDVLRPGQQRDVPEDDDAVETAVYKCQQAGTKVWQKAHELTLSVYRVTAAFPREELFGLTNPGAPRRPSRPTCRRDAGGAETPNSPGLIKSDDYQELAPRATELKRMLTR